MFIRTMNSKSMEVEMQKRYGYVVMFIISAFFAISFSMIAIVSLFNPTQTIEFIKMNPLFSWINPTMGYVVHTIGNIFFTAVATFVALNYWRRYNE